MLIAFQKSSQNREATQNGGVFSLEEKRDFTIHWLAHNFKEQASFFTHAPFCVLCAFLKLPQFSILLFLPLFGTLASSSNRIQAILFRLTSFLSALLYHS